MLFMALLCCLAAQKIVKTIPLLQYGQVSGARCLIYYKYALAISDSLKPAVLNNLGEVKKKINNVKFL